MPIYYDPKLADPFTPFAQNALMGYGAVKQFQKGELEKKSLEYKIAEEGRKEAFRKDSAAASKKHEERVLSFGTVPPKPARGPYGIYEGAEKYLKVPIVSKDWDGPLGITDREEANSQLIKDNALKSQEIEQKVSESQGEAFNDVMNSAMKNGLPEVAMSFRKSYYDHVSDVAKFSKKAAVKIIKGGPDAKLFPNLTEKDINAEGKYAFIDLKGTGKAIRYNTGTGESDIIDTGAVVTKEEKGASHVEVGAGPDMKRVMAWNPDTKKYDIPVGTPYRIRKEGEGEGGPTGKGAKWTLDRLSKAWDKLKEDLMTVDEDGNKVSRPGMEEYISKIVAYRSQDEIAVGRGNEPTNYLKVADALVAHHAGKGGAETPNYKDGKWYPIPNKPGVEGRWTGSGWEERTPTAKPEKPKAGVPVSKKVEKPGVMNVQPSPAGMGFNPVTPPIKTQKERDLRRMMGASPSSNEGIW